MFAQSFKNQFLGGKIEKYPTIEVPTILKKLMNSSAYHHNNIISFETVVWTLTIRTSALIGSIESAIPSLFGKARQSDVLSY